MPLIKTAATIFFYFPVSTLWDKVQQYTGMVAKNLPKAEGVDIEKYAVTSDDLDFFHREMVKALTHAYELCHKLSTGLTMGIVCNGTSTITTTGEDGTIPDPDPVTRSLTTGTISVYGFYVKNLLGHRDHALNMIDVYIESLLVDMFQRSWWLKCGLGEPYKVSVQDVILDTAQLNNSMYALYKPIVVISPAWSTADVTIDDTGVETDNTTQGTDTPSSSTKEVQYYDSVLLFPATGVVDIIYVDRSTNIMYDWSGSAYQPYGGVAGEYSVQYVDTDSKVCVHNLGKMMPHITGINADGNQFDVIWTPEDINSGTARWNTVGSGTLIFD